MRLENVEAVGPDPPLREAEIRMPVVRHRGAVLVDDHLEVAVAGRAETRLDEATGSRAGLRDELGSVPGLADVAVVAPEVPEFCGAVGSWRGTATSKLPWDPVR